eukprot:NODE_104_length_19952_cov_0.449000.p14 type:complete len:172 gc:universal NODE_104_length_19952_cov_0.449000:18393-17878(-)
MLNIPVPIVAGFPNTTASLTPLVESHLLNNDAFISCSSVFSKLANIKAESFIFPNPNLVTPSTSPLLHITSPSSMTCLGSTLNPCCPSVYCISFIIVLLAASIPSTFPTSIILLHVVSVPTIPSIFITCWKPFPSTNNSNLSPFSDITALFISGRPLMHIFPIFLFNSFKW